MPQRRVPPAGPIEVSCGGFSLHDAGVRGELVQVNPFTQAWREVE
ncbi:hypothetical protein RVF83_20895 [Gordonia rubripertincta]|uniref:Uncharacterized protein n=1 Tax=Gordonia rubripertincta TaxID=36822 RepID=A0AAW6R4Y4_GORRU|nr:hypothetical protein [Gordonia rubripertincta]MDG6779762.1 hypothetical protein [Gordonia rubripertincta]